ncbi:MAG: 4Fe-4S dicluster domain-containing protein [Planctomycetaceae bacterium]|nr:4Fe-4S dicluster domain-containing protein [Planctomycetaceae bacterium]
MSTQRHSSYSCFLSYDQFAKIFDVLHAFDYEVIGPTLEQEAIVYGSIRTVDDLPRGWTDIQEPGRYRLQQREDDALFGYVVGPHSWKQFLFPPVSTLSTADRTDVGWQFSEAKQEFPKVAYLGVRACEIAAMQIQDRVFLEGPYVDHEYQSRRRQALIIAVNCTQAASTCFCTSMNTGPRCQQGFDLALTELPEGFLVEVATPEGEAVINSLESEDVTPEIETAAETARQNAVEQIKKELDTTDIRNLLMSNLEHPHWDEVAERCLSCTNCTMVCPTCFCSSVEEVSDLSGDHVERQRQWDSCFNVSFSYMNGGLVRNSIRNRYRQWLTHKLATWNDQFGTSGCVGCGRCITWCPVGIDLTEEVAILRQSQEQSLLESEQEADHLPG